MTDTVRPAPAPAARTRRPWTRRSGLKKQPLWVLIPLIAWCLFIFVPFYVMFANGMKTSAEAVLSDMWNLPGALTGAGFALAWSKLGPNMLNSAMMVIPATLISSFIGSVMGYVFAKWPFPGSTILFILVVLGFYVPYQSVIIPLIQVLQAMGLYGTLVGLILTHVVYGIPVTTLIFWGYYRQLPRELVEAAKVDGAGVVSTYRLVFLPLSIPAFIVAFIFQFTSIWNDFLFGIVVVPNPKVQPITVALNNLSGTFSVAWNAIMAGAILAAIPTIVVYVLLSRYFIEGLTAGYSK
jgi:glucose/mannose transport system permease protein